MDLPRHPPVPARHRVYPLRPVGPPAASPPTATAESNGGRPKPPPAWSRDVPRERRFPRR